MDEVAVRSDMGPGAERVVRALQAAHGGLRPAELVDGTGLGERACRRAVARLVAAGVVARESAHGKVCLAGEGDAPVVAVPAEPAAPARSPSPVRVDRVALRRLAEAADMLPTAAHRGAFRLLLAATVARHHSRREVPSGWPSVLMVGPSKTAKSLLGLGALRAFGLDPALHVRAVPGESERSLWGRRAQQPGGGWTFHPTWVLGEPLLVLDEADKASRDILRAVLRLVQGEAAVAGEGGELVEVAPTVLICANGGPNLIPHEYRRRSVVVDTGTITGEMGADLSKIARRFLAAVPPVSLDGFRSSWRGELSDDLADDLADMLRAGLSDDGWRMVDERALAHVLPGWAMLWSGGDLHVAVGELAGAYFDTAATVGELAGSTPAALPDAKNREDDRRERAAREAAREERELEARLALAGRRLILADRIRQGGRSLEVFDSGWRPVAVPLLARLAALAVEVDAAGDEATLDRLAGKVADAIAALAAVPSRDRLAALGPGEDDEVEWDDDGEDQDDDDDDDDEVVLDGRVPDPRDDPEARRLVGQHLAGFVGARKVGAGPSPWLGGRHGRVVPARSRPVRHEAGEVEPLHRAWRLECGHWGASSDPGRDMARAAVDCRQCRAVRRIIGAA